MKWDKDDPLHREIMELNADAWRLRQMREALDRLYATLPWWARAYCKVVGWLNWIRGK